MDSLLSLCHKCQRMPYTIATCMQLNIGGFLIWQFTANSPNRQIKNLAKVSRYTVYVTVHAYATIDESLGGIVSIHYLANACNYEGCPVVPCSVLPPLCHP